MKYKIDRFRGDFFFLSNMFPCKFEYGEVTFKSVEHAYQYHKTMSPEEQARVLKCNDPKDTKRISRTFKFIRYDWHEVKAEIMYHLVKEKFLQNKDLSEALLMTKNFELIEGNWWGDVYWGVYEGRGKNILGKILMIIRDEFFRKSKS